MTPFFAFMKRFLKQKTSMKGAVYSVPEDVIKKDMRPIKFRAWDNENKVWLYLSGLAVDPHTGELLEALDPGEYAIFDRVNYVLEQFTGLTDKTGKEIYEGDILKSPYTEYGHVVEFHDGAFIIRHNDRCCPPYRTSLREAEGWQAVIGNIHENPDLV